MGNTSLVSTQNAISLSSLFRKFEIVKKDQQRNLTIVKEKDSDTVFIIKELLFIDKSVYQKHLCRFNHFQEIEQSQNVLNLKKVWTQEHNTFCSNTYKIFPMYEYSLITLSDQMQARKSEKKHFEDDQLLGLIQSCINALNSQSPSLISPSQYFIVQDGLLKLNNVDLFDEETLTTWRNGVFYSPEKMQHFESSIFYCTNENYLKQSIFSLGMTLLSCIYLQQISDKIYNPLNPHKKMRLNAQSLDNLIKNINLQRQRKVSKKIIQLVEKMLDVDPKNRPSLNIIQKQLDDIVKEKDRVQLNVQEEIDLDNESDEFDMQDKVSKIQLPETNSKQLFKVTNLSTISDKNSKIPAKQFSQNSQIQILRSISQGNVICSQNFHEQNKINKFMNPSEFEVPMIASTNVNFPINHRETYCTFGKLQQVDRNLIIESGRNPEPLPSPISNENPLFTNPQFLAKINEDIKHFTFQRKNSFASTQISRKNSQLTLLKQSGPALQTKKPPNISPKPKIHQN